MLFSEGSVRIEAVSGLGPVIVALIHIIRLNIFGSSPGPGPRPVARGPGPGIRGPGPGPEARGPGTRARGPGPGDKGPGSRARGPEPLARAPGPGLRQTDRQTDRDGDRDRDRDRPAPSNPLYPQHLGKFPGGLEASWGHVEGTGGEKMAQRRWERSWNEMWCTVPENPDLVMRAAHFQFPAIALVSQLFTVVHGLEWRPREATRCHEVGELGDAMS